MGETKKEKTMYNGVEDPRFLKLITLYDKDNKVTGYKPYNKGGSVNKMMYGGMAKKKMMMGGYAKKDKKK
tara:strand:- start:602 stop:811 length:210 start_codon:yes stop_codon:yes gene_type:complete